MYDVNIQNTVIDPWKGRKVRMMDVPLGVAILVSSQVEVVCGHLISLILSWKGQESHLTEKGKASVLSSKM